MKAKKHMPKEHISIQFVIFGPSECGWSHPDIQAIREKVHELREARHVNVLLGGKKQGLFNIRGPIAEIVDYSVQYADLQSYLYGVLFTITLRTVPVFVTVLSTYVYKSITQRTSQISLPYPNEHFGASRECGSKQVGVFMTSGNTKLLSTTSQLSTRGTSPR